MANTAHVFVALQDPTRRTILESLRDGPRAVGEIARRMPVTRPAVSQHLQVLKKAMLVADHSEGTRRIYAVDRKGLGALRIWLDQFRDHGSPGAVSCRSGHGVLQKEKSMSETILYGLPGSPFLRTVEIVLKEKEIPYRLQTLAPGELQSEQHLKRHPFGRVPVLELDGFTLYETQAIIRYVDDLFMHPKLTPEDPRERARMNQIIGIIECYFFPKAAAPIGFNRVVGPVLFGLTPDEDAIREAMPVARTSIAAFEDFLDSKPFLTGTSISLADVMLAAQYDIFSYSPEGAGLLRGTRLQGWLQDMKARPSLLATEPPEKFRPAA